MNEKLQYATMLEIPVNTCNITYKPSKKRRLFKKKIKNPDAVKEELLLKVNSESETFREPSDAAAENSAMPVVENTEESMAAEQEIAVDTTKTDEISDAVTTVSASVHKKRRRPVFKFTAVTAEIVAVFALVAVIFLTNAFYKDSAINVFMRKVFSPTATETAREKTYDEFAPVMNFNGDVSLNDGVISCTGSGSVYAPVDGVVSSVNREENGTYTMNIATSGAFSTVISGLTYAYLGTGDTVYGNIPVGYVTDGGFTVCFNSGENVITEYTIENGAVLWAV